MTSNLPTYKVALLGAKKVGKSAIFSQALKLSWQNAYKPTPESFGCSVIKSVENHSFNLTLRDTKGWDEFPGQHVLQWIQASHGLVLVYSVASRASFELVKSCIAVKPQMELALTGKTPTEEEIPISVVGYVDGGERREVSNAEGENLGKELVGVFVEISRTNLSKKALIPILEVIQRIQHLRSGHGETAAPLYPDILRNPGCAETPEKGCCIVM